jgi:hypothetical protein
MRNKKKKKNNNKINNNKNNNQKYIQEDKNFSNFSNIHLHLD